MYLLLEVLNDGYKVYDTVQKCDIEVPKTLKPISGVVNDYISVPYSDCELKLAQLIEFEALNAYNGDFESNFCSVFDKTSLMCLQTSYYGEVQYISIFGFILNNLNSVSVFDNTLVFNLSGVCITFKILDIEKFILYTTKFKVLSRKVKPKVYMFTYNENSFSVFENDKVIYKC